MSMSNATENATLKMHLQGTDPTYRANATGYVALLTLETVDEASPMASEVTYTGYARLACTKSSFWTDNGSSFANAVLALFGKRTDAGATQQANSFAWVDTASGDVSQCIVGQLNDPLDISINIQPVVEIGGLVITAD